jgi:CDP-4-dehydro-6-deoxyglucose reductase
MNIAADATKPAMSDFNVTIRPSGKQFSVREHETILAAALRQGIMLPYSCRNGSCGSCQGQVLDGRVHYPRQAPLALNPQQLHAGQALFCQAVPQTDLTIAAREIDAVRDIPVRMLPARVQSRELLADNVARLRLTLPQGQRLQFLAGQYIDILLPGGQRRAFSLANAPHDEGALELHVRHVEGGDFTEYVFKQMPERAIVRFEGPLGTFFLREDSTRPMLMMAGGTGYAPLKAMLDHALHSGLDRSVHLFWGARNRAELYALEQAQQYARSSPQIRFDPVLSEPAPEDRWQGATGWVHEALLQQYADQLEEFDVYMSGPPAMINAARQAFAEAGLPAAQLYYDSFDFAPRSAG